MEQANSKENLGIDIWDRPPTDVSPRLLALKAGEAIKVQGAEAFSNFHLALLKARHEDRKDLKELDVIIDAAQGVGVDVDRLRADIDDPSLLRAIADSHTEAVQSHGVFGVPTFVFPDGGSAFLKMFYPPREESVGIYDSLTNLMCNWVNIGEIKRPQPPWPAGVR